MKSRMPPAIPSLRVAINSLSRRGILAAAALAVCLGYPALAANTVSTFGVSGTDLSIGSNYSPAITVTSATASDVALTGSYTAGTTFTTEAGTLNFGTLDDTDITQALTIADGTITLNSAANSVSGANAPDILYVASGANLAMDGGLKANVSGNFDIAGAAMVAGVLSGTGNLTQTGGGTLVLGGANTNSGSYTLTAGTLQLDGTAAMSNSSGLSLANGTTLALVSDTSGSFTPKSISIPATSGTYNFSVNPLSTGSGQTLTLSGALSFGNDTNNVIKVTGVSGYTLGLGAITLPDDSGDPLAPFGINASGAGVSIASITAGGYGITLNAGGAGPISIATVSTNSNGYLAMTSSASNLTITTLNTNTGSGVGTVNVTGGNTTIGYYNIGSYGASINVTGGAATIGGMNEPSNGGVSLNINGGTLVLTGTFALNNSNQGVSYPITVTSGTLDVNNASALGYRTSNYDSPAIHMAGGVVDNTSGSAITIYNGNGLGGNYWYADGDFSFGGTDPLNIGLGNFYLSGGTAGVATRTITVSGTAPLTIGGPILPGTSTGVALAKTGPGTMILSGNSTSTFTGAATVKAGTLIVSGSIGGGATTVGDLANPGTTAILEGTGLVGALTVGASAVNTGAILDPGNVSGPATGTLKTAALTFSGTGANLAIQLGKTTSGNPVAGTNFNSVTASGTVTLGGANLELTLDSGFATSGDALYFIINNTSAQPGGAANLGELAYQGTMLGQDAQFMVGSQWFQISYDANPGTQTFDGAGDSVALEAIPEARTWGMLLGGFGLLWTVQGRRRRRTQH
ncbi:MAG TPA: autotransporter-associated beta strand repeat-containing protein [Chthoniobacteraceae bacterium]|nr:autotransporter-associated beta strand repeat-containing protein [Chthoniobacteraceae bacterium]